MEKMRAHAEGRLHRAFSIFLFNSENELLIHQRAHDKYHSSGLWTNTCCSHPRPGESLEASTKRRLEEEMGMDAALEYQFQFTYRANLDQGLVEHELDHVYFGFTDSKPTINPQEVQDWRYVALADLELEMTHYPERYTEWFKIAFHLVRQRLEERAT